jgi:hypothetical protein
VAAILCIKPQPQLSEGHSFQGSRPRDVDISTADLTYMLSALRTLSQPWRFTSESCGGYNYGQLTTHSQDPTAKNSFLYQHGCLECDFGR